MNDSVKVENLSAENKGGSETTVDPAKLAERLAAVNVPTGTGKRRGPGRPPGSKSHQKNRVENVPRTVDRDSPDDQRKNCAFFVETALFLFESGDEFIKRSFLSRLRQYIKDEKQAKEFELEVWNKNAFTPADRDRLANLLLQLAIKYPILQKVGPEIGLLVFMVQYGIKTMHLARAIESLKPKAAPVVPAATGAN